MTVADKIDAKLVKDLREKSGAPMGDCLKALQETVVVPIFECHVIVPPDAFAAPVM